MTSIAPITDVRRRRAAAPGSAPATSAASQTAGVGSALRSATVFTPAPRKAGGVSVQERFATLIKRFKPEAAKGVDARFHFKLSGKGGGEWYCEIKGGKLTVKQGDGPNKTASLRASAEDYKKIAEGDMNKTWAFLRGKLKVEGDKDALSKWDSYFEKP